MALRQSSGFGMAWLGGQVSSVGSSGVASGCRAAAALSARTSRAEVSG